MTIDDYNKLLYKFDIDKKVYDELRYKYKKQTTILRLIITATIVSTLWCLLVIRQCNNIIDRYNNAQVLKTTAYTLHYNECRKLPGHKEYGMTYTGTRATVGRTVAVDPNYITLGTHIYVMQGIMIQGKKYFEFIAEDTGDFRGEQIDIFWGNENYHKIASKYGVQYCNVFIEKFNK